MMGQIKEPMPVKLVISMFSSALDLLDEAQARLCERFGPVDLTSPLFSFTQTDYYTAEFGPDLKRRILAFDQLIDPGRLAEIKHVTNALEEEWAVEGQRRINLDPGYLSLGKLVLATTKDHAHRIYIGQGIYAEVTLYYRHKAFTSWPWSYPDYASAEYLQLFAVIRHRYALQLHVAQRHAEA